MEGASEDGREAQDPPASRVLAARLLASTQGTGETTVLRLLQQLLMVLPQHLVVSIPVIHPVASLASGFWSFGRGVS
jgi:hypothetical protein